jgi:hypothetical protein
MRKRPPGELIFFLQRNAAGDVGRKKENKKEKWKNNFPAKRGRETRKL